MRKSKLLGIFIFSLFALTGVVLFNPQKAFAATFTVDSINDGADSGTGDNICDDGSGACTLRAAIDQANATVGPDIVNFNIPGAGVHTITPGSNFATISEDLTIDATTQPGSNCGTLVPVSLPATSNTPHTLNVFIDAAAIQTAFDISAGSTTIRGFAIADAQSQQISINGGLATIECNYIGTAANGADTGGLFSSSGIVINSNDTIVQNNLISSNGSTGISGSYVSGIVQDNLIGTTPSGGSGSNTRNTSNGINMNDGGTIQHNIISGNGSDGIAINNANDTVIKGNFIGVALNGTPLGNQGAGLSIFAGNNFSIGGTNAADRNIISANTGDGVHVYTNCQSGNRVTNSTIFNNYIGTKSEGRTEVGYGNGAAGIEINEFQSSCGSVYQHKIGGDNAGEPNIIAGNITEGVLIHQDSGHDVFSIAVLNNSIYGNGTLGIDLAADADGSTGTADTDMGPNPLNELFITYPTQVSNSYLNHPVINSAIYNDNHVTVNYDFKANAVEDSSDGVSMLAKDLVGYRLDFYLNDNATDGTYPGYAQGKTHLGSFIVDGSETGANHTFTSPVALNNNQTITVTATVLWTSSPTNALAAQQCDGGTDVRTGVGPPYTYADACNEK